MATATKKIRAAGPVPARGVSASSLQFLVYRDNGGSYHWEIAEGGQSLVHSMTFGSHEDAERAARYVYDRAGAAAFGPQGVDERKPKGV